MNHKLLIVDDDNDILNFSRKYFEKRDILVFIAESGEEALEILEEQNPDLVLLDVQMGGISGVETLKKLREKKNDLKVIMVTGVTDEEVINEANSWGVVGYINKPLILEELEKTVLAELNK